MSAFHLFFLCLMLLIIFVGNAGLHSALQHHLHGENHSTNQPVYSNRKMNGHGVCSNRDISISQSKGISRGIPQYIVEIANTCMSGCTPSNLHLHCGWFASVRIVNPKYFKRLSFDDCLVNDGKPLKKSQMIRFSYSNSFMYPLAFKYAHFC